MKTSESISKLAAALVKAQAQMGAAVKGSKNPFFKSNYSDLPTVMEVVKGPLNENGLIVLQPSAHRDGKNFIDTVIIHESGEFISSETEVICAKQNDAQNFGAGQTYARRFGLQAMLFIPSEDDDGNSAAGKQGPAKPAYQAPAPQAPKPAPVVTNTGAPVVTSVTNNTAQPAVLTGQVMPTVSAEAAPSTGVAPLQKSSFRKTPAAKPAEVAPAAPADSEWGN